MKHQPEASDVVVIGAGMAGLTAADELRKAGVSTIVLDKGRVPGGRMATRTIEGASFDHGAQHFSVRSDRFRDKVDELRELGVVAEWYKAESWTTPGLGAEARLIGTGGMRRIPEHLASGLDVRNAITIDRLHPTGDGYAAVADNHAVAHGSAVVLTAPVPQLLQLLANSDLSPEADVRRQLESVQYNPSLTVMAVLDRPSGLPEGHLAQPATGVAWLADNQDKGVSKLPAITIHSTAEFASAHLDEDRRTWARLLTDRVAPLVEGQIVNATAHRWRYAEPQTTFDSGAVDLDIAGPVVLAGEVFAGAKVEGAFLSGLAAAEAILNTV